jgi:hypothetical protein
VDYLTYKRTSAKAKKNPNYKVYKDAKELGGYEASKDKKSVSYGLGTELIYGARNIVYSFAEGINEALNKDTSKMDKKQKLMYNFLTINAKKSLNTTDSINVIDKVESTSETVTDTGSLVKPPPLD